MSPFGAAAVAVLGLLLGLVLEAAAPSRGAEDRPGWYRPAGWVVMGLALVLLLSGTYGRVSGGLTADNPYVRARAARARPTVGSSPSTTPSQAADDLVEAETAMFLGHATPAQKGVVRHDAQRRATDHVRVSSERDAASIASHAAGRALRTG